MDRGDAAVAADRVPFYVAAARVDDADRHEQNGEEATPAGPRTPVMDREPESSICTPSRNRTIKYRHDSSSDSSDSEMKQPRHRSPKLAVKFGANVAFAEEEAVAGDADDDDVERRSTSEPRRRIICDEEAARSIAKRALYKRLLSNPKDELRHFRSGLAWLGLDQSTPTKVVLSWIVFSLFAVVVPVANYTFVSCSECGEEHSHPFEQLVQVSESALAAVSFFCLSHIIRHYGLRRTLLLDKIMKESHEVQLGYEQELHSAFSLLRWILLPCFLIELIFRVWWYLYVSISIPFFVLPGGPHPRVINVVLCFAGMLSWLYRTSVFLFMCVLFRLMCCLQILRLKGYKKLLEETPDVSIILSEHMRIRSQLLTISHRFRIFMVSSLFTISFSQMCSLFVILGSAKSINFFRAGDLAVCSVVQLTGLVLCLHGAAKITHRAQRIVGIVSHWHALATCNPSAVTAAYFAADHAAAVDNSMNCSSGDHPPNSQRSPAAVLYGPAHPLLYNDSFDDLADSSSVPRFKTEVEQSIHDFEAYQKRQALVTYLQHSRAGISLYGFVLDRGFLYAMFGVTFSLTLFILGKTII
ncbi:unnamed protein product [Sphagnum jensenii]|uniref:Gustatory receptor n=1 Tax=Sphagnum jensenii TaxID=128206 RepID=A0ABP1BZ83_9BRYO